jgi:acetoin utilization protein AcuB
MALATIMSKNLIYVDMDDDLGKVKSLFEQHNIHHILVTEEKKLVGIITDRDLYKHLSPNIGTRKESHADIALLRQKAHQIMSRTLITATPEMTIKEAVIIFDNNHISCLPITNDNNEPIGIITWRDILAILALSYKKSKKT